MKNMCVTQNYVIVSVILIIEIKFGGPSSPIVAPMHGFQLYENYL